LLNETRIASSRTLLRFPSERKIADNRTCECRNVPASRGRRGRWVRLRVAPRRTPCCKTERVRFHHRACSTMRAKLGKLGALSFSRFSSPSAPRQPALLPRVAHRFERVRDIDPLPSRPSLLPFLLPSSSPSLRRREFKCLRRHSRCEGLSKHGNAFRRHLGRHDDTILHREGERKRASERETERWPFNDGSVPLASSADSRNRRFQSDFVAFVVTANCRERTMRDERDGHTYVRVRYTYTRIYRDRPPIERAAETE